MNSDPQQSPCCFSCPVAAALDVIGGKWKTVILYHLFQDGTLRFNQLRRMVPGVTQRMLTRQLRELERDGVVRRIVYPEVPPKVEYELTDMGGSLKPVLISLKEWGSQNLAEITAMREQQTQLELADVE